MMDIEYEILSLEEGSITYTNYGDLLDSVDEAGWLIFCVLWSHVVI